MGGSNEVVLQSQHDVHGSRLHAVDPFRDYIHSSAVKDEQTSVDFSINKSANSMSMISVLGRFLSLIIEYSAEFSPLFLFLPTNSEYIYRNSEIILPC